MHSVLPPMWMWIVWAAFTVSLLILLAYRGTLTRYEEDQLFLDDASDHQHRENDLVLRKVAKIQPLVRIFTGATCVFDRDYPGTLRLGCHPAVLHVEMPREARKGPQRRKRRCGAGIFCAKWSEISSV